MVSRSQPQVAAAPTQGVRAQPRLAVAPTQGVRRCITQYIASVLALVLALFCLCLDVFSYVCMYSGLCISMRFLSIVHLVVAVQECRAHRQSSRAPSLFLPLLRRRAKRQLAAARGAVLAACSQRARSGPQQLVGRCRKARYLATVGDR